MTQAETGTDRDYSVEAVKARLSHGRSEAERSKKPLAMVLDGLALLILLSPYIPGITELYLSAGGAPYLTLTGFQIFLFLGARFVYPVPTLPGWAFLVGASALLIYLFI
jgi:hypothetical protein